MIHSAITEGEREYYLSKELTIQNANDTKQPRNILYCWTGMVAELWVVLKHVKCHSDSVRIVRILVMSGNGKIDNSQIHQFLRCSNNTL